MHTQSQVCNVFVFAMFLSNANRTTVSAGFCGLELLRMLPCGFCGTEVPHGIIGPSAMVHVLPRQMTRRNYSKTVVGMFPAAPRRREQTAGRGWCVARVEVRRGRDSPRFIAEATRFIEHEAPPADEVGHVYC